MHKRSTSRLLDEMQAASVLDQGALRVGGDIARTHLIGIMCYGLRKEQPVMMHSLLIHVCAGYSPASLLGNLSVAVST